MVASEKYCAIIHKKKGYRMKKKIHVKHTHRYTLEKSDLYIGECEFNVYDSYWQLSYRESDDTKVTMYCYENYIRIERFGEVKSKLSMKPKQDTNNPMESAYGTFYIVIHTHDYKREDAYVMVEYDVVSGDPQQDGFKIEIAFQEDSNEYN